MTEQPLEQNKNVVLRIPIKGIETVRDEVVVSTITQAVIEIANSEPQNTNVKVQVRKIEGGFLVRVMGLTKVTLKALDNDKWSLSPQQFPLVNSVKYEVRFGILSFIVMERSMIDSNSGIPGSAEKARRMEEEIFTTEAEESEDEDIGTILTAGQNSKMRNQDQSVSSSPTYTTTTSVSSSSQSPPANSPSQPLTPFSPGSETQNEHRQYSRNQQGNRLDSSGSSSEMSCKVLPMTSINITPFTNQPFVIQQQQQHQRNLSSGQYESYREMQPLPPIPPVINSSTPTGTNSSSPMIINQPNSHKQNKLRRLPVNSFSVDLEYKPKTHEEKKLLNEQDNINDVIKVASRAIAIEAAKSSMEVETVRIRVDIYRPKNKRNPPYCAVGLDGILIFDKKLLDPCSWTGTIPIPFKKEIIIYFDTEKKELVIKFFISVAKNIHDFAISGLIDQEERDDDDDDGESTEGCNHHRDKKYKNETPCTTTTTTKTKTSAKSIARKVPGDTLESSSTKQGCHENNVDDEEEPDKTGPPATKKKKN
jgi:hypothetical protein